LPPSLISSLLRALQRPRIANPRNGDGELLDSFQCGLPIAGMTSIRLLHGHRRECRIRVISALLLLAHCNSAARRSVAAGNQRSTTPWR
jgi:hypothetical protein